MSKELHKMMGMYMVCKNETKPNFEINKNAMFGTHITYKGKPIQYLWCPMLIKESPNHDVDYKVLLAATGLYKGFIVERAWYTCDIESRCRHNEDIRVFDDYDEAMEYAIKMNEIEYPAAVEPVESFWNKISRKFNELFKKITIQFN
jgi:hypothetical protein